MSCSKTKTNIVDSAYSIDSYQPKYSAQANPGRHFSPPVDFLFHDSLLYPSIHLRRNVSTWNSLHGLRRLIWVDTLRKVHNVGFLVERLICIHVTVATTGLQKDPQKRVRIFLLRQICCWNFIYVLFDSISIWSQTVIRISLSLLR